MARPARRIDRLRAFLAVESAGGMLLLGASIIALIWANASADGYQSFWAHPLSIDIAGMRVDPTRIAAINDGLMTLFFLVIGLEVKRELAVGALRSRRAAMLPLWAAAGGMLVPALIYLAVVGDGPGSHGWGVPIATDVAFALAALGAFGRRIPPALVAFLLGVAVIDDIGSIIVIAVAYSQAIHWWWLVGAGCVLAATGLANRLGVRHLGIYGALAVAAWWATIHSGVHPTIAGVAIGLLIPVRPRRTVDAHAAAGAEGVDPPLERLVTRLHPYSAFLVLPLFALANAGITFDGSLFTVPEQTRVTGAVVLGLVVGKLVGLSGGAFLASRLNLAALPAGVTRRQLLAVSATAGIGFTVSLFITDLAFTDPGLAVAARTGVFAGSLTAFALGALLMLLALRGSARRAP